MLDASFSAKVAPKRALARLNLLKSPLHAEADNLCKEFPLIKSIIAFDPTPKLKYVKWMLTRLHRAPESMIDLIAENAESVRRILTEFDAIKPSLPVELRDIFNYQSMAEVEVIVKQYRQTRTKARKAILNGLEIDQVMSSNLVLKAGGLSVHRVQSVEEVVVATANSRDFSRYGLYEQMTLIGDVYMFNTDFGLLIGAMPVNSGQPGVLLDFMGEPAMFEDALNLHPEITWATHRDILEIMVKIDPKLPFDFSMTDAGAYICALNQLPQVIFEDRYIPDDLLEDVINSHNLSEEAMSAVKESIFSVSL